MQVYRRFTACAKPCSTPTAKMQSCVRTPAAQLGAELPNDSVARLDSAKIKPMIEASAHGTRTRARVVTTDVGMLIAIMIIMMFGIIVDVDVADSYAAPRV